MISLPYFWSDISVQMDSSVFSVVMHLAGILVLMAKITPPPVVSVDLSLLNTVKDEVGEILTILCLVSAMVL